MKSEKRVKLGKRKVLIFVVLIAIVVSLTIVTASVATHYGCSEETVQAEISNGNYWSIHPYCENVNKQLALLHAETGIEKPNVDALGSRSLITSDHPEKVQVVDAYASYANIALYDIIKVYLDTDILESGIYSAQYIYDLSVGNANDTSDTNLGNIECMLQADNITDANYEEYAQWNESSAKWVFPSDYVLVEDDWLWIEVETSIFETKYVPMSIGRSVNKSVFDSDGYQLAEFNVTFDDISFNDLDFFLPTLQAEEHSMANASFMLDTLSTDAPLHQYCPFLVTDEHYIQLQLDKSALQANKTYNFSVVVQIDLKGNSSSSVLYKPSFGTKIGFNVSFDRLVGTNVTIPSEMLPEHIHHASASTNVSNIWDIFAGYRLEAGLDEISESLGPKTEIYFTPPQIELFQTSETVA